MGEWISVPEHSVNDTESSPTVRGEQELVENDSLLSAEVIFPRGDGSQHIGKIVERKRNADGNFIGRRHDNPICDTREYVVRYPDGSEDTMTYAKVVKHLYSQVDNEGNQLHIYHGIVGHRKSGRAIDKSDQWFVKNGRKYKHRRTAGWDLEVEWKDGTSSWLPLSTLKKDNPIDVAQYAVDNRIDEEPAFDWWAREVLKRSKRLIGKAQKMFQRTGYKYGIEVSQNIKHALELDAKNGNDFWRRAIAKERAKVLVALKFLKPGERAPVGFQKITGNWVFDVKMDLT